ncbi:hypothetical protein ADUPG1_009410, partial [Aduncisulcus paluster]
MIFESISDELEATISKCLLDPEGQSKLTYEHNNLIENCGKVVHSLGMILLSASQDNRPNFPDHPLDWLSEQKESFAYDKTSHRIHISRYISEDTYRMDVDCSDGLFNCTISISNAAYYFVKIIRSLKKLSTFISSSLRLKMHLSLQSVITLLTKKSVFPFPITHARHVCCNCGTIGGCVCAAHLHWTLENELFESEYSPAKKKMKGDEEEKQEADRQLRLLLATEEKLKTMEYVDFSLFQSYSKECRIKRKDKKKCKESGSSRGGLSPRNAETVDPTFIQAVSAPEPHESSPKEGLEHGSDVISENEQDDKKELSGSSKVADISSTSSSTTPKYLPSPPTPSTLLSLFSPFLFSSITFSLSSPHDISAARCAGLSLMQLSSLLIHCEKAVHEKVEPKIISIILQCLTHPLKILVAATLYVLPDLIPYLPSFLTNPLCVHKCVNTCIKVLALCEQRGAIGELTSSMVVAQVVHLCAIMMPHMRRQASEWRKKRDQRRNSSRGQSNHPLASLSSSLSSPALTKSVLNLNSVLGSPSNSFLYLSSKELLGALSSSSSSLMVASLSSSASSSSVSSIGLEQPQATTGVHHASKRAISHDQQDEISEQIVSTGVVDPSPYALSSFFSDCASQLLISLSTLISSPSPHDHSLPSLSHLCSVSSSIPRLTDTEREGIRARAEGEGVWVCVEDMCAWEDTDAIRERSTPTQDLEEGAGMNGDGDQVATADRIGAVSPASSSSREHTRTRQEDKDEMEEEEE